MGEFVAWMRDRKLHKDDLTKVLAKLELLRVNGTGWGRPHVRHIAGELWELKVNGEHDAYRVYFVIQDGVVVCLAYGRKSTQDRDIIRAQGRLT